MSIAPPVTIDAESGRWARVLARDPHADGAFVYAVRSTGVYCRPTCPARRPGREQVRFFSLPESAEQAGFRPCRRCNPRDASPADTRLDLVRRACALIEQAGEESPPLARLSGELGVSPGHLQRTFRRLLGVSPAGYAAALRQRRLRSRLRAGAPILEAIYAAGYGSPSRVYGEGVLGMPASDYRQGAPDRTIRFDALPCSLGFLLVAATDRGICAVRLGSDRAGLEAGLREEFPGAVVVPAAAALRNWVAAVLAILAGDAPDADLPLDLRATAFQWQVWQALRRIPAGEMRTYGEIAAAIGRPGAARAVGSACAANPVALVVPCHRVVRGDGGLGGYRWGIERKRQLLAGEGAAVPAARRRRP